MTAAFPEADKFVTKLVEIGIQGYVALPDLEVVISDNSYVVLRGPDIDYKKVSDGDPTMTNFESHSEYFAKFPERRYGEIFIHAMRDNNLPVLRKLYKEKYNPKKLFDEENVNLIFFDETNVEATQFIIDSWPKFIDRYVTDILEDNMFGNNLPIVKYQLRTQEPSIINYLSSRENAESKLSKEILVLLHEKGANDFQKVIEEWNSSEEDWPFPITPTSEGLAYILEVAKDYRIGNRLRYLFYVSANEGEKEKWYNYIDEILNREVGPANYHEIIQTHIEEVDRAFLALLKGKGYDFAGIQAGEIFFGDRASLLLEYGMEIKIRNIVGYQTGDTMVAWSQGEAPYTDLYRFIKDQPHIIRKLMRYNSPETMVRLNKNIIKRNHLYFYLMAT